MDQVKSKKAAEVAKNRERDASSGLFKADSPLAQEKGVSCNATISLRVPEDLKLKLKEMPDWQNLLRQYLVEMVGY